MSIFVEYFNTDNSQHELTSNQDLPDRRLAKAVIHRAIADLDYYVKRRDEFLDVNSNYTLPQDYIVRQTLIWIRSDGVDNHSFLWWLSMAWKTNGEIDYYLKRIRNYVADNFKNP